MQASTANSCRHSGWEATQPSAYRCRPAAPDAPENPSGSINRRSTQACVLLLNHQQPVLTLIAPLFALNMRLSASGSALFWAAGWCSRSIANTPATLWASLIASCLRSFLKISQKRARSYRFLHRQLTARCGFGHHVDQGFLALTGFARRRPRRSATRGSCGTLHYLGTGTTRSAF